jgi:putative aminopeptidase FrvX
VYIKELTELNGVSGNEDEVREYIKKCIKELVDEISIDSMGNLIAFKKGKNSKYKVMLSAHMDEVGFMVTGFGERGQTVNLLSLTSMVRIHLLPPKKIDL